MAERCNRCTSMRQRVWTGESTMRTATSISATTSATGATKWTPRRLGAVETGGTPLEDLRALHQRRRYGSGRKAYEGNRAAKPDRTGERGPKLEAVH
jgi:hypothetical protein